MLPRQRLAFASTIRAVPLPDGRAPIVGLAQESPEPERNGGQKRERESVRVSEGRKEKKKRTDVEKRGEDFSLRVERHKDAVKRKQQSRERTHSFFSFFVSRIFSS